VRQMRCSDFARLSVWCLALAASPLAAETRPAGIFGDNMVLQCGVKAPIWGTADAGQQVTVALGTHRAEATAGQDGKWLARLGPLPAGGPFEMTITGKNTVTCKNVMVGEVWVCSGQSNMQMPVAECKNASEE